MSLLIILGSILAAALPVVLWYIILRRKEREHFFVRFFVAFFFAGVGAIFFFANEEHFKHFLTDYGLPLFLIFFLLGACIEYFKNIVVRFTGKGFVESIDDVMDLSFAAALGFTFFENIFHFIEAFSGMKEDISGPVALVKYFLTREFFILPVHLFCSGIFGYFYGISLFAKEELMAKNEQRTSFRFLSFFAKFALSSRERVFRSVKILEGTIISVFFYSVFFLLLEKNYTTNDFLAFFGLAPIGIQEYLMPLISFFFFRFGTIVLFSLMDRKRRWKQQNMLTYQ